MNKNGWITIALFAAICGAVYWATQEMSAKTEYKDQRDSSYRQNGLLVGLLGRKNDTIARYSIAIADLNTERAKKEAEALSLQNKLTTAQKESDQKTRSMNRQEQFINWLQSLVQDNTISQEKADELSQNPDATIDPSLVAGTSMSLGRYNALKETAEQAIASVAEMKAQKETAEQKAKEADKKAQRANDASLKAEEQFLLEAATNRFGGFGRKKASLKRAAIVRGVRNGEDVTELEKELNAK